MSWDVLLLRLPGHVTSVEGVRDHDGMPPLGRKPWVLDTVRRALPGADLTDPAWGQIEGPGWSIELNISPSCQRRILLQWRVIVCTLRRRRPRSAQVDGPYP